MKKFYFLAFFLLGFLLFLVFSPSLDLWSANCFYHPDVAAAGGFSQAPWVLFMYRYGVLLCWPFALAALTILVGSSVYPRWKRWRFVALAYLLTMAIGPGLLVHEVFKDSWNRPRPLQTENFMGPYPFRPLYAPDFSPSDQEPRRSFPSGHASGGFVFFSLYFSGRRYGYRVLAVGGLLLGLFWGGALGFARMAQGGHYLSDIVTTGILVLLVAWATDRLLASPKFAKFL